MPCALIEYPAGQEYTRSAIIDALRLSLPSWTFATDSRDLNGRSPNLQWSDYDRIDWDLARDQKHLVSSYVIRKALIRKNHLSHTLALYLAKNPQSPLKQAVPTTLPFSISFPDELDELLQDELYELGEGLERGEWFILKPALADKGSGINLFNSELELRRIFEELEEQEGEDDDDEGQDQLSTMREYVVQRYLTDPLILKSTPRKFHLRVYVVCQAALAVWVHRPFLALFADSDWSIEWGTSVDLNAHLTNTCLQNEGLVKTWQQLEGETLTNGTSITSKDIRHVEQAVENVVAELFKAAVSAGSGFQPLPNAFEIFGLDFVVSESFQVSFLEANACPDFAQTGDELREVVQKLFNDTTRLIVRPFFEPEHSTDDKASVNTTDGLRKVLEMELSKGW